MNFLRNADGLGATAGSSILPVMALGAAVSAGMVTAVLGSTAGYRAIYYVSVFGLIVAGGMVTLTRKEPLRFAFLALILCLPLGLALVPPGRLDLSVFDLVMIVLTTGLIARKALSSSTYSEPLFPSMSLAAACLLSIPCVVLSQYPWFSTYVAVVRLAAYGFFLFALYELSRERGFERLVLLFSVVSIFMAGGLLADHVLHLNLSLRGSNLNQVSYISGMEIYRAGGFFQDPQRAGAFLACMVTFLLLLSIRGRFRGMKMRFVVWTAVVVSPVALVLTISRGAILACLLVCGMALFAFNKWNAVVKLLLTAGTVVLIAVIVLAPTEAWLGILPAAVSERFLQSRAEFDSRLMIWFDTWDMFADHPIAGIGPGSFKPYLIDTRPGVINYYGIGANKGVEYIPDQPENGYLKILYEGGILGSIAALVVAGDAVRRAVKVIARNDAASDARTEGIAALAGLLTFAITFVTLYTLSEPRIASVFSLFLAVIWHRSLQLAQAAPKA